MTTLATLRREIIAVVTGLTTYDHVPGRVTLPCAFIVPGDPYISGGQTIGARRIKFGLVILTAPGLNQTQTAALDTIITRAVTELEADGWVVTEVRQPTIETFNQTETLATEISIVAEVKTL